MGSRANIKLIIEQDKPALFIYSHWHGRELPSILQDALHAAKGRWTDESYCTRILIDQITKSGRDEETGWGLSFHPDDNDGFNLLVVNVPEQTVKVCRFGKPAAGYEGEQIRKATFDGYLELTGPDIWSGHHEQS